MKIDVRYLVPGTQVPTGPDTDALIAEHVLELELIWGPGDTRILAHPRPDGQRSLFPYSAEYWATALIIEHLHEAGAGILIMRDLKGAKGRIGWYECNVTGTMGSSEREEGEPFIATPDAFAYQPTFHQAVCQAALIRAARAAAERGELEVIQPDGGI